MVLDGPLFQRGNLPIENLLRALDQVARLQIRYNTSDLYFRGENQVNHL